MDLERGSTYYQEKMQYIYVVLMLLCFEDTPITDVNISKYGTFSPHTESCDHSGSDTPPVTSSTTTTAEEASDNSPATREELPSSAKSFAGIRSVVYLNDAAQAVALSCG